MTFMPPFRNAHFSGEHANLKMYSIVNQVIQIASTSANLGLSMSFPFTSFVAMEGMVFKANAIVDTMTKDIEITATTCENNVTHSNKIYLITFDRVHLRYIYARLV